MARHYSNSGRQDSDSSSCDEAEQDDSWITVKVDGWDCPDVGLSRDTSTPQKASLNILDVWECESIISGCGSGVQLVDTCDQEEPVSLDASRNLSTWTVLDECSNQDRRQLCNILWELRPHWTPRDLVAVENKLAKVGISTVAALADALAGDLNQQLRKADQPVFLAGTIAKLKRHVGIACTRSELANAAEEKGTRQAYHPNFVEKRILCNLLWESRPNWNPETLLAAERRLARVGIETVNALDFALAGDLNERLRNAGLKTFSDEAIKALKRHRLDRVACVSSHKEMGKDRREECVWWRIQMEEQEDGREASLRGVLKKARPSWTLQEQEAFGSAGFDKGRRQFGNSGHYQRGCTS